MHRTSAPPKIFCPTYGLRGVSPNWPVFQDEQVGLCPMDAPDKIPLGSMSRWDIGGVVMLTSTVTRRGAA